jgi:hypothetical protein
MESVMADILFAGMGESPHFCRAQLILFDTCGGQADEIKKKNHFVLFVVDEKKYNFLSIALTTGITQGL